MSAQQMGFTIFLALLFVVVIPVVTTKNGSSMFQLRKKENNLGDTLERNADVDKVGFQSNGNRGELLDFMAALLKTSQQSGVQMVCPGTLNANGESVRFAALLVAEKRVLGVYCLGYGGCVSCNTKNGDWKQVRNEEEKQIPNYFEKCKQWQQIGADSLNGAGITGVSFEAVAVFTNKSVVLDIPLNTVCFKGENFLERVKCFDSSIKEKEKVVELAQHLSKLTKECTNHD